MSSSLTTEYGAELLAPGWTARRLLEREKVHSAEKLYERGSATADDAATFANVTKVSFVQRMEGKPAARSLSEEEIRRDAQRYVAVDPEILSGTPCLKGTRVPVYFVADMLANGDTVAEIITAYPHLTEGQVHAAAAYARAFPERARPPSPPWRNTKPNASTEVALDDLPPA